MKYQVYALWLMGACCAHMSAVNQLQGIYHHRSEAEENRTLLELGKVALYFSAEPQIKQTEKTQKNMRTVELFFPESVMSPAARSMLATLARTKSPWYSVRITTAHKDPQGITCAISYNTDAVVFTYETCESIKLQKGVVFTFYDKNLLNRIATHNKNILRTAWQNKPGIIIDVGHGGSDLGACGCGGILEKEITLGVGLKLATLLRHEDFTVFMTRADDQTLSLDSRTTFANCCGPADLFVSVHANAAPDNKARGIETFYVASSDKKKVCMPDDSYADVIDALKKDVAYKGRQLATAIQNHTVKTLAQAAYPVIDRHVKSAVSQVLIGVQVPAALIEVGFVSCWQEGQCLIAPEYQMLLAQGICAGIKDYLHQTGICA